MLSGKRAKIPAVAIVIAAAITATGSGLSGQSIQGELVEQGTGLPVRGAFVLLFDEAGEQHDSALTTKDGRFVLAAPGPGIYQLGVDRIGYLSTKTDLLELSEGEVLYYRLQTRVEPVILDNIDVAVEQECIVRPEEGVQVARVWEEARKALNVTAYAQQMGLLHYTITAREKRLDPYSMRVRDESFRTRTGITRGSPYVSLPAENLARKGYVRLEEEEHVYYGLDAQTLLSDTFLDTHCLGLETSEDTNPGLIGLTFRPQTRQELPDVEGTLWLDAITAELQHLEYSYTGLPPRMGSDIAGGRVEFEQLETGEWIIRRWWIRMPLVRMPNRDVYSHLTMNPNERVATVVAIEEDSGEVTRIVSARTGEPTGAAPDRYRSRSIPVGELERGGVPTADREGPCRWAPGGVGVAGVVRDSITGIPLPGARVRASWEASVGEKESEVRADASGRFLLCALPIGSEIGLQASFPSRAGTRTVTLGARPIVTTLDLPLSGSVPVEASVVGSTVRFTEERLDRAGEAAGFVADDTTGRPLEGAQVSFPDLEMGSVTDAEGAFRVTDLPAGDHRVRVEYLGYESAESSVPDDAGGRPMMAVRLVPAAVAVAALEVRVPPEAEIEERAMGERATILTHEDVRVQDAISVGEMIARNVPGVRHYERAGCPILVTRNGVIGLVVIDGQPFRDTCVLTTIQTTDIERLELMPSFAATIRYGRPGGGGVIVIETKHGRL